MFSPLKTNIKANISPEVKVLNNNLIRNQEDISSSDFRIFNTPITKSKFKSNNNSSISNVSNEIKEKSTNESNNIYSNNADYSDKVIISKAITYDKDVKFNSISNFLDSNKGNNNVIELNCFDSKNSNEDSICNNTDFIYKTNNINKFKQHNNSNDNREYKVNKIRKSTMNILSKKSNDNSYNGCDKSTITDNNTLSFSYQNKVKRSLLNISSIYENSEFNNNHILNNTLNHVNTLRNNQYASSKFNFSQIGIAVSNELNQIQNTINSLNDIGVIGRKETVITIQDNSANKNDIININTKFETKTSSTSTYAKYLKVSKQLIVLSLPLVISFLFYILQSSLIYYCVSHRSIDITEGKSIVFLYFYTFLASLFWACSVGFEIKGCKYHGSNNYIELKNLVLANNTYFFILTIAIMVFSFFAVPPLTGLMPINEVVLRNFTSEIRFISIFTIPVISALSVLIKFANVFQMNKIINQGVFLSFIVHVIFALLFVKYLEIDSVGLGLTYLLSCGTYLLFMIIKIKSTLKEKSRVNPELKEIIEIMGFSLKGLGFCDKRVYEAFKFSLNPMFNYMIIVLSFEVMTYIAMIISDVEFTVMSCYLNLYNLMAQIFEAFSNSSNILIAFNLGDEDVSVDNHDEINNKDEICKDINDGDNNKRKNEKEESLDRNRKSLYIIQKEDNKLEVYKNNYMNDKNQNEVIEKDQITMITHSKGKKLKVDSSKELLNEDDKFDIINNVKKQEDSDNIKENIIIKNIRIDSYNIEKKDVINNSNCVANREGDAVISNNSSNEGSNKKEDDDNNLHKLLLQKYSTCYIIYKSNIMMISIITILFSVIFYSFKTNIIKIYSKDEEFLEIASKHYFFFVLTLISSCMSSISSEYLIVLGNSSFPLKLNFIRITTQTVIAVFLVIKFKSINSLLIIFSLYQFIITICYWIKILQYNNKYLKSEV